MRCTPFRLYASISNEARMPEALTVEVQHEIANAGDTLLDQFHGWQQPLRHELTGWPHIALGVPKLPENVERIQPE